MFLTGFADEASHDLAKQIQATKELGWKYIESRFIGEKFLGMLTDEEFDKACEYFRQICGEIGALMGVEDFKGGYEDMPVFYAHESYKTDKGMQLAIAWSGCNDFCNHEAAKIGLGSPAWWYKCWGIEQ